MLLIGGQKKQYLQHFVSLIAQLGVEKTFRFWCLSHLIRGIIWGVDIDI